MIIIKLQGGLGNQLFQYALGKTIEKTYNKEVAYDISSFEGDKKVTPRSFLLDKFKTKLKIANNVEIREVKESLLYLAKKILNKFFFKKYHIAYEADFLDSIKDSDSMYLEGYWQSVRYVEPCIIDLREEIVLVDGSNERLEGAVGGAMQGESVAVHVRRGDYVTAGTDLSVLDISYYKMAKEFLCEKLKNPHFYVFTDDAMWVKEQFTFLPKGNTTYVSELGLRDYEELILMTTCKNAVIANSSFSWWGAMLRNEKGLTLCPKDWKNAFLKNDENLCPDDWIRI
ncbi:MAG: alpha-1,2-fucosyltransferase [Candidatus Pacebacteria bacterium]|jgi:hypothetical protein|nr:alpha-1,2-fucosyltransferase [Candidatus Paceibacterota bacterium]